VTDNKTKHPTKGPRRAGLPVVCSVVIAAGYAAIDGGGLAVRPARDGLRAYGIKRGVRGPRGPRATSGRQALTPTELKIAALIARGDSTLDIARGMFLSRRTVQSYISHILAKLGAKGRADIVREALRQGISP